MNEKPVAVRRKPDPSQQRPCDGQRKQSRVSTAAQQHLVLIICL